MDGELDVVYYVGVDDGELRQVDAEGEIDVGGILAPLDGVEADIGSMKLTARFYDYGKQFPIVTPRLTYPRFGHDAILLDDGRVLVAGGWTGVANNDTIFPFPLPFSQTYDSETALWTIVGLLTADDVSDMRPGFLGSTLKLRDGRVMSVGFMGDAEGITGVASAFHENSDSWTPLAPPPSPRGEPDMALLGDGRVLVAGGLDIEGLDIEGLSSESIIGSVNVVEIFDPGTGAWQQAAVMKQVHQDQAVVSLNDGRVMVVGGVREDGTGRAELYDPTSDTWTLAAGMNIPRANPAVVVLSDGRALITGDHPAAEIYDPAAGTWTLTGRMARHRVKHTLTLLPDGRALAAGGEDPLGSEYVLYSTTEIFDPRTNSWSPGPDLSGRRSSHSATLLPDGRVLLVGGIGQVPVGDGGQALERVPLVSTEIVEVP